MYFWIAPAHFHTDSEFKEENVEVNVTKETRFPELLRKDRAAAVRRRSNRRRALLAGVLAMTLLAVGAGAQETPDLTSLSVDDLMNVEVTSVSRKGQKVADTAAAVFVITQDDIQRSGATCIPEVLRIVPGLNVARINGNVWAISVRGFNGQFANKLLVMIDGRIVYTPLFSGVYWDVQDTLLEDVDRIEVIRGPGGTLWGANAVNGIINIITKHAIETQGALLSGGLSSAEGPSAAARYGRAVGNNGYFRIYGKAFDRPASVGGVNESRDAWALQRAGFRSDWASRRGDNFTLQGDLYRGTASTLSVLIDPNDAFGSRETVTEVTGQNLQFQWSAVQSRRSDTTLNARFDYSARADSSLTTGRRTFTLDFQQHLDVTTFHDVVWGVESRISNDRARGPGIELVRDVDTVFANSAFVQTELRVTPKLHLTAGTKLQYDEATKLQLQPTLRLMLRPSERHSVWAAATSAVRTPSEIELYGRMNVGAFPDGAGGTGLVVLAGDRELKPERVEAYEAGYRWQPNSRVALDAAVFRNRIRNLVGTQTESPTLDPSGRVVVPVRIRNAGNGKSAGAELLATSDVTPRWNVALGYSFFRFSTTANPDVEASSDLHRITTPRHQVQLRSFLRLSRQIDLSSSAFYVGPIGNDVPSYVRLDGQLSWRPARRWTLTLSGQNLLREGYYEFVGSFYERELATPVQRTLHGQVTWRF